MNINNWRNNMYKVTWNINESVNFFKWFKSIETATEFASTKLNSIIKKI